MQAGFAKTDITPRVGVELCGFGPFLNRRAVAVRDRLWARAAAFRAHDSTAVIVSCDLVNVELYVTRRIRQLVGQATGLRPKAIMVHCTHTHSGPASRMLANGWGSPDGPYLEILPYRIARACIAAVRNMADAEMSQTEAPCEGVGLNREQDIDAPPIEEALRPDWRPAKPELTDTKCRVLKVTAGGRIIGFLSYFGCHPVVCCQETRHIHGDYAGVATNLIESEHPGAVGLFLQGAHGDVNSCVVHKPEKDALPALDVIAARFARSVRAGLARTEPLTVDSIAQVLKEVRFKRLQPPIEDLRKQLSDQEAIFAAPDASDEDHEVRMAAVYAPKLRGIIAKLEKGEALESSTEVQGFRLGPVAILASPFETFQAIKNDVVAAAKAPIPLVLSLANDLQGYAPDRDVARRGGYAAQQVPLMFGSTPFANIHDELVDTLLEIDRELDEQVRS